MTGTSLRLSHRSFVQTCSCCFDCFHYLSRRHAERLLFSEREFLCVHQAGRYQLMSMH